MFWILQKQGGGGTWEEPERILIDWFVVMYSVPRHVCMVMHAM